VVICNLMVKLQGEINRKRTKIKIEYRVKRNCQLRITQQHKRMHVNVTNVFNKRTRG